MLVVCLTCVFLSLIILAFTVFFFLNLTARVDNFYKLLMDNFSLTANQEEEIEE